MTLIAGIDPGLNGAIALLDTAGDLVIHDMPTLSLARNGKGKREIDTHRLAAILGAQRIGHAFIERIGAMPGQGVSSVFAFGKCYGIILGVLAAVGAPQTLVTPVVWKRALAVPAAKDGARARASQLLPQGAHNWPLVKHDGRAESALIALWGLRSIQSIARGEAA